MIFHGISAWGQIPIQLKKAGLQDFNGNGGVALGKLFVDLNRRLVGDSL